MALNIDLAPTLLELAGVVRPAAIQGTSLVPILKSGTAPGRKAWVYELFRDFPFGGRVPPHKALRTGQYKYIEWQCCRDTELYDLKRDPREMHNLMGTPHGEKLAPRLKQQLAELTQTHGLVTLALP
jgi:arylsulfatase A-like enzyme